MYNGFVIVSRLLPALFLMLAASPELAAQTTKPLPSIFDSVDEVDAPTASNRRLRPERQTNSVLVAFDSITIRAKPRTFRSLASRLSSSKSVVIELPLSAGHEPAVRAVLTDSTTTRAGSVTLSGVIAGDGASQVDFLLSTNNAMTGTLTYTDSHGLVQSWRTAHRPSGVQVFERFVERTLVSAAEEDDVQYLQDSPAALVDRSLERGRAMREQVMRRGRSFVDDGRLIDLMVLYSESAQQLLGGRQAIESAIEFSVEKTNLGWIKSRIQPRLRLVHTDVLANYPDTGLIDLEGLAGNGDGLVDYIHSVRNSFGADLVLIIGKSAMRRPGQRVCGVGYFPNDLDPRGDIVGFSYVQANCVVGALSFPHEIGHNLGALHDRAGYNGGSTEQSNYGFVTSSKRYRTVMAYSRTCGSSYCPRINYWSSPTLRFRGEALGTLSPASVAADNVRQLNSTALRVSRYRRSRVVNRPAIVVPRPQSWINGDGGSVYFADNGIAASAWRIKVGNRRGSANYFESSVLRKGQRQVRITGVPTDGRRVFVTLEYLVGSQWLRSSHIYRSYTKSLASILTEIQPLRNLLVSIPFGAFSSFDDRRFLLQRLNLLQQAVKANDISAIQLYRSQFRARTNGCTGAAQIQPDANDYLINCNTQSEVDVYSRQIQIAAQSL